MPKGGHRTPGPGKQLGRPKYKTANDPQRQTLIISATPEEIKTIQDNLTTRQRTELLLQGLQNDLTTSQLLTSISYVLAAGRMA